MALTLKNKSGEIKIPLDHLLHHAVDLVEEASEFESSETLMDFLGEVLNIISSKELKYKYVRNLFKYKSSHTDSVVHLSTSVQDGNNHNHNNNQNKEKT